MTGRLLERGGHDAALAGLTLRRRTPKNVGFTLIEILAAIAIIGMSLLVLLDSHYAAMRLFSETQENVLMNTFLQRALGEAEVQVLAGTLNGAGDFGAQYPDYNYSFAGQPIGETETVPLYQVTVNVTGPEDSRSMMMMLYLTGQ